MTGVSLQLDGTTPSLAILRRLEDRLENARPLYDEIGSHLELSVSMRFERETGPGNDPWKPSFRAKSTGGQTLTDTERLKKSMKRVVTNSSVEHGTNVEYAAIHQHGGVIRAKPSKGLRFKFKGAGANRSNWATRQQVTLPARPFIGLDAEDEKQIIGIVERYLEAHDAG